MSRLVLLDTSIVIDHLRGNNAATEMLATEFQQGSSLTASVLTKVEVLRGMRSAERVAVRRFLSRLTWVPVDSKIADIAGEFACKYRSSHHSIEVPDYVIAATAEYHIAELWTLNIKHFPMFDNLGRPY